MMVGYRIEEFNEIRFLKLRLWKGVNISEKIKGNMGYDVVFNS